MKYLILAVTMIFLPSCTGTSYKMNDLSIGMTKNDVISVLGKPVSVSAKDGTEYLNYQFSENSDQEFLGLTEPYFVRLISGKVDSYGKLGDFDSTQKPTIKIETQEEIKIRDGDLYGELKKIKELRDDGILTEQEFQLEKRKILGK
jgi:outer membrane protein assembly factor BamE (lipoprotein component of BamABCDE complex)